MAKHFWINQNRIDRSQHQMQVNGITFHVRISPYDIPTAITGEYESETQGFRITFKYIDDEPAIASKVKGGEGIIFREGKHSGKLLSIWIPTEKNNLAVVDLQTAMEKAFASRKKTLSGERNINSRLNQDIAENILKEDLEELVSR